MKTYLAGALALAVLLTAGVAQAQDTSELSEPGAALQAACLVDDRLSVWLSLESADRMVASLEKERRELTEKLAKHSTTLKLMDEGKIVSEGGALNQIGMLLSARTGGREALITNCSQIETRLTEVSKTLKRRRLQRDRLEEWVNVYLGLGAADGS